MKPRLLPSLVENNSQTQISNVKYIPKGSMYGIYTYIYLKKQPNVGKYTIHGSYGIYQM